MARRTRGDDPKLVAAVVDQWEQVARAVDDLPDEAFAAPSRLPGWTVAHLVVHTAGGVRTLIHALSGPHAAEADVTAVGYLGGAWTQASGNMDPAEMIAEAARAEAAGLAAAAVRARLRGEVDAATDALRRAVTPHAAITSPTTIDGGDPGGGESAGIGGTSGADGVHDVSGAHGAGGLHGVSGAHGAGGLHGAGGVGAVDMDGTGGASRAGASAVGGPAGRSAGADGVVAPDTAGVASRVPGGGLDRLVATPAGGMRLGDFLVTRAVEGVVHGLDLGVAPARDALRIVVRVLADVLASAAPGRSVELRVPPFAAVQLVAGPRHTRGTPPNVVEAGPVTFVELAAGRLAWADAVADGRVSASGDRSDISGLVPVI